MEKFLKYLACFIVIFSFCLVVHASQEEVDKAKEAMTQYCQEDKESLKGCIYDPNDTMYTHSGAIKNSNFWVEFKSGNIPLTRGYVTANAQGEMVFAGCYKGHYNGAKDDSGWIKDGDYFVFKIVALDGGKCKVIEDDIVFAKGTKYKHDYLFWTAWDGEFDGGALGADMATYIEWTATNCGECPKGFGLTANTKWYTTNDHKYVFSNDGKAFNTGVNSFGFFGIGSEEYITTPGCTVQDKTGHELAEACFNDASNNINNTKCPSDYSKLSEISSSLEELQNSCDNKFRTLYSKGLLESDAKEMKDKLVTAVNNKLASCQNNQCKVTDSQQEKITNNLKKDEYKLCNNGKCPADNYLNQSSSKNAKCYKIGNGTNARFEWTDNPLESVTALEKDISKSECYGTVATRNCRECLKKVYKASGLSNTQINCMLNIEGEKSSIENQSEKEIDNQFDQKKNDKLAENDKIREEAYTSYEVKVPEIPTEDPSKNTCEQILGENLTAILKVAITIMQIVGAIIAIVKGMMTLIPPILAKDADALKKASKTLVTMAIILVIIFLFRPLLRFLGNLLDFDISCI